MAFRQKHFCDARAFSCVSTRRAALKARTRLLPRSNPLHLYIRFNRSSNSMSPPVLTIDLRYRVVTSAIIFVSTNDENGQSNTLYYRPSHHILATFYKIFAVDRRIRSTPKRGWTAVPSRECKALCHRHCKQMLPFTVELLWAVPHFF